MSPGEPEPAEPSATSSRLTIYIVVAIVFAIGLQTGWYFLTVMLGLAFHANVTLCFFYWIFTRKNPFHFMSQMSQAILTAFSTASSSATLPITMKSAVNTGISKKSVEFVIPVGATINMDGTALYEAVAAIFILHRTHGHYPGRRVAGSWRIVES